MRKSHDPFICIALFSYLIIFFRVIIETIPNLENVSLIFFINFLLGDINIMKFSLFVTVISPISENSSRVLVIYLCMYVCGGGGGGVRQSE